MRQERITQATIFEVFAEHEIGREPLHRLGAAVHQEIGMILTQCLYYTIQLFRYSDSDTKSLLSSQSQQDDSPPDCGAKPE